MVKGPAADGRPATMTSHDVPLVAGRVAYCASKHAVLTKALALEWVPHGICVNAVAPTFIHTPLTGPFFGEPGFRKEVLMRSPLRRIGDVQEVVGMVVSLLSREAGRVLAVDGGWTAE
jgi:NAD(P)-dependent dehydrogenase (short-subunit alcohol dehydrogenase family)